MQLDNLRARIYELEARNYDLEAECSDNVPTEELYKTPFYELYEEANIARAEKEEERKISIPKQDDKDITIHKLLKELKEATAARDRLEVINQELKKEIRTHVEDARVDRNLLRTNKQTIEKLEEQLRKVQAAGNLFKVNDQTTETTIDKISREAQDAGNLLRKNSEQTILELRNEVQSTQSQHERVITQLQQELEDVKTGKAQLEALVDGSDTSSIADIS